MKYSHSFLLFLFHNNIFRWEVSILFYIFQKVAICYIFYFMKNKVHLLSDFRCNSNWKCKTSYSNKLNFVIEKLQLLLRLHLHPDSNRGRLIRLQRGNTSSWHNIFWTVYNLLLTHTKLLQLRILVKVIYEVFRHFNYDSEWT